MVKLIILCFIMYLVVKNINLLSKLVNVSNNIASNILDIVSNAFNIVVKILNVFNNRVDTIVNEAIKDNNGGK